MTLGIDVDRVKAVLLADGWHHVAVTADGDDAISTFDLDSYEYLHGENVLLGGGNESGAGVSALGFIFKDAKSDDVICGPLSAILAVRLGEPRSGNVW